MQYTLKTEKESIATIPFITYATGFVSSFLIRPLAAKIGSKKVIFVGISVALGFAAWIQFSGETFGNSWQVYVASAMNGLAGTSLAIASLSLISDLTADSPGSSAFVFGCISFTDKLVNGLSIFTLESVLPVADISGTNLFYKNVIVGTTAASAAVLVLDTLLVLRNRRIGVNVQGQ